jgi:hypothetical protein
VPLLDELFMQPLLVFIDSLDGVTTLMQATSRKFYGTC